MLLTGFKLKVKNELKVKNSHQVLNCTRITGTNIMEKTACGSMCS